MRIVLDSPGLFDCCTSTYCFLSCPDGENYEQYSHRMKKDGPRALGYLCVVEESEPMQPSLSA